MPIVLNLNLPGGDTLSWCARDEGPVRALSFLARVTGLPLREMAADAVPPEGVNVLQGRRGERPAEFHSHSWSHTQWRFRPEGGFDVRIGNFDNYTPEMTGSLVRWLFFLALVPHLVSGRHFLVHGAFFREADGCGAALFGPSGVGKSTAAASLEREGLTVFADDAFILTPQEEGLYFVNVSPTWSIYTNHKPWREFDCGRSHSLKRCYLVDRGAHCREPLPPWQAGVLVTAAFVTLTEFHLRRLPDPALKRALETKAFAAAGRIARELPLCRLKLKLGEPVAPLLDGAVKKHGI